ncbi:FAD-binding domain-containing protein [Mollisia scopiformis]|uniref:FAD-binding domain-containing protein n=1 Tax=Mollisia scopiformis TaxID=149040 RepID=A0A132B621_MOLSC|nr:FAD-binding domain-containing protein [Mollisia scopiformis]KUJ07703.1 FAD-binding domain-containing protein [Mollisia scopiformis]
MDGIFSKQVDCLVKVGLRDRVVLPTTSEFAARIDSYFNNSAKLTPACIFMPQKTAEVVTAIKALVNGGQKFAIRSGGSNFWPSNNIDDGVTMDLKYLNTTEYDPKSETVMIGAGVCAGEIYERLAKYERAVGAAREASVGIAGLALTGGITLFTGRYGFACDQVVAYEVVLADGRVVIADATGGHKDLFKALKGGGNNFGIVTHFTMRTFPCSTIWGGGAILPKEIFPKAAEAIVDFVNRVSDDPDTNLICMLCKITPKPVTIVAALYANMAGVERPPILDKWLAFPEVWKSYKKDSILGLLDTTEQAKNYYGNWFTLCFKNDATIIMKAAELHDALVEQLQDHIKDGDFKTQCVFQPLPLAFIQTSSKMGGNVMGLEQHDSNGIIWGFHVMVRTPELEAWALPRERRVYEGVREFAQSIDGLLNWTTANYAHPTQEVFQNYGKKNVEIIKEVAARYDPDGVFQYLCPGGFKISSVQD